MAIDKYLKNITSQHRDKTKYMKWVEFLLETLDDCYNCIKSIDINFDIDNAIGVQLDQLGEIIGRKRILTFQPIDDYYPIMDDETYRLVLKTKIAMNNWDGLTESIYQIWKNIFDDLRLKIKDGQDMSFECMIYGFVNPIRQDLIQNGYIIPKPEGVRINYIGASEIDFFPYIGIMISEIKTETIDFEYNPPVIIEATPVHYGFVGAIEDRMIDFRE